jgi:hypothetical protein
MFLAGFNCGHCRQRKAPPERGQVSESIDPSGSHILTDTGKKEGPTYMAGPSPSIIRKSCPTGTPRAYAECVDAQLSSPT